jgi:hypothetical protein
MKPLAFPGNSAAPHTPGSQRPNPRRRHQTRRQKPADPLHPKRGPPRSAQTRHPKSQRNPNSESPEVRKDVHSHSVPAARPPIGKQRQSRPQRQNPPPPRTPPRAEKLLPKRIPTQQPQGAKNRSRGSDAPVIVPQIHPRIAPIPQRPAQQHQQPSQTLAKPPHDQPSKHRSQNQIHHHVPHIPVQRQRRHHPPDLTLPKHRLWHQDPRLHPLPTSLRLHRCHPHQKPRHQPQRPIPRCAPLPPRFPLRFPKPNLRTLRLHLPSRRPLIPPLHAKRPLRPLPLQAIPQSFGRQHQRPLARFTQARIAPHLHHFRRSLLGSEILRRCLHSQSPNTFPPPQNSSRCPALLLHSASKNPRLVPLCLIP